MAEQPTLLFRDDQTGTVYSWVTPAPAGGSGSTHTLIDESGREIEVSDGQMRGDFARYRLFGVDLPVGVELLRREDDGSETAFTLEAFNEGSSENDERQPWHASFRSADGSILALSETDLLEGLQETPPVYRFAG